MLTKILFTIAVILVVLVVYQAKFRITSSVKSARKTTSSSPSKTTKRILYGIAVFLALTAGVIFYFKWQVDYRVMTIKVVSGTADSSSTYKAYQKDIKGRTFTTLDGRLVTLGDADRIELLEE